MKASGIAVIALLLLSCLSCDSEARDKAVARAKPAVVASPVGLGDLHALVVGVSDYHSAKVRRLKLSAKDAEDFARFLKSQEGKLFRKSHVKLLTNRQATKRRVTHHLFQGLRKAHKRDTVIIFLSGHGMEDPTTPGEHYFLTYDADPESLESTAVNITKTRFIKRLDAKKILLIADACQAGGYSYDGTKAVARNAAIDSLLARFKESEGELILTSSRADEHSREKPEYGNSLFTYHLIEGLKGAGDANKDGLVALKELYDYVYEKTKKDSNGLQSPQMRGRLVGEFPMALTSLRLLPLPRPSVEPVADTSSVLLKTDPGAVKVRLGSKQVGLTDKDGAMILHGVKVGTDHSLRFEKEGYESRKLTLQVPSSYAGNVYPHDTVRLKEVIRKSKQTPGLKWVAKGSYFAETQIVHEGGLLFTYGDQSTLKATSAATGRLKWSRDDAWCGGIAAGYGLVFHNAEQRKRKGLALVATEINTRREKWRVPDVHQIFRQYAVVGGGVLFVLSDGTGRYLAIDARTGKERWRFKHTGASSDHPAVSNHTVVFHEGRELYAMDIRTGRRRWQRREWCVNPWTEGKILSGLGLHFGPIKAWDIETGRRKWSLDLEAQGAWPVIGDGVVCFVGGPKGEAASYLYAVQAETGRILWNTRLSDRPSFYGLTVAEGVVFVPCEQGLHAFDIKTGTKNWSFQANCWMSRHPLVLDGVIYFGTYHGDLCAVDIKRAEQEYKGGS